MYCSIVPTISIVKKKFQNLLNNYRVRNSYLNFNGFQKDYLESKFSFKKKNCTEYLLNRVLLTAY